MRNLLIVFVACLLAGAPAGADDGRIRVASDQLLAAASVLPPAALVTRVRQLANNRALPAAERRAALHRFLLGLRQQGESVAGHAALVAVAQLDVPGLAPHPENPAWLHDPSGLAAAAQGTRNAWQFAYWQRRAERDLAAGSLAFVGALNRQPEPAAVAGAAQAILKTGPTLDAGTLERLATGDLGQESLAAAAFEATGKLEILDRLVAANHSAQVLRLVRRLDQVVAPEQAVKWWAAHVSEPALAPLAMAGLAAYPTPESFTALAAVLDHPQLGVAAAHGLRQFDQPWASGELEKLRGHSSADVRRRVRDLLARQERRL